MTTTGALLWLIRTSTRNRLKRQVARLKSPRYALAALFGVAYVWFFFFRGVGRSAQNAPATVGSFVGSFAGFSFWVMAAYGWLVGASPTALAFQPAEMMALFPGPLTRRQLLGYRIMRSQVQLLLGGVLWAVLLRRWGVNAGVFARFAAAWGFFSVLSLHRLATALTQVEPVTGTRRAGLWLGRITAGAAVLAVLANVMPAIAQFNAAGFSAGVDALKVAIASPPASWALAPAHWLVAPLYTPMGIAWWQALGVVALIAAAHIVWIMNSRVKFEEAAALATQEYARRVANFRARRAGGGVAPKGTIKGRQWLPLSPMGPPAIAILWKNTYALIRMGIWRTFVFLGLALGVLAIVAKRAHDPAWSSIMGIQVTVLAVMLIIVGPRTVRNDLRQDLLHLPQLKTLPLSGASVVAAEIAAPTVMLTALQFLLLGVAWWVGPADVKGKIRFLDASELLFFVPITLFVFNGVAVTVQNAAALMFPGWVRLGPQSGGVEAIGQNILVMIGSLLTQGLLLLLPALLGGGVWFTLRSAAPAAAMPGAVAGGLIVLAAELVMFVLLLGGVFDRLDPSAVAAQT